jgi:hypothetical protein
MLRDNTAVNLITGSAEDVAMPWFRDNDLVFKKTGAEIKAVVRVRVGDLSQRLAKRNAQLDRLMEDKQLLRSYLVRDPDNDWPHGGQRRQETPSEEHQEITELCRRICVLEKELLQLRMVATHMQDEKEFDLSFEDMVKYGFPV